MGPRPDDDRSSHHSDDGDGGTDEPTARANEQSTSDAPSDARPSPRQRGPPRRSAPDGGKQGHPREPDRTAVDAVANLAKDLFVTAIVVGLLITLLFGVSGVWPPLVAVESDSMEPQIMTGDLVFIMDTHRLASDAAIGGTGVVPVDRGIQADYETFGGHGDVIIFAPNGNGDSTPIIHRAHLWVESGENWADRADGDLVSGTASCDTMAHCPAPHAGFITHGDNNRYYDQEMGQSEPVRPDWIIAKAQLRVPWLGNVRLLLSLMLAPSGAAVALAFFTKRGG